MLLYTYVDVEVYEFEQNQSAGKSGAFRRVGRSPDGLAISRGLGN